jgi:hypothetical protein
MSAPFSKRSILLFVALFVLAISTTACSINGSSVIPDTVSMDVTIRQAELDWASRDEDSSVGHPCHDLLDELTRVEIHDGFIRYFGIKHFLDGSHVHGSFDLTVRAEDGVLNASVVAIDIPGFDLDDPRVLKVNRELEHQLTDMANQSSDDVYFDDVTLREGEMNFKLQIMVGELVGSSVNISIP